MPFTPFHFGPGGAIHALAPRHISFIAFAAANVLVDVEPLYYLLTGQDPLHRFFHTYVGVTLVIAATVLRWRELTLGQVIAGAAAGGWSHIVLDSIMHADIRPLAPFSQANPLYLVVSIDALHDFCLGTGATALVLLGCRWVLARTTIRR
jgi:membrane-bound metal-dependent hydrolase YbcI (DUF457 family)